MSDLIARIPNRRSILISCAKGERREFLNVQVSCVNEQLRFGAAWSLALTRADAYLDLQEIDESYIAVSDFDQARIVERKTGTTKVSVDLRATSQPTSRWTPRATQIPLEEFSLAGSRSTPRGGQSSWGDLLRDLNINPSSLDRSTSGTSKPVFAVGSRGVAAKVFAVGLAQGVIGIFAAATGKALIALPVSLNAEVDLALDREGRFLVISRRKTDQIEVYDISDWWILDEPVSFQDATVGSFLYKQ
jgi:hypothetical protein